GDRFAAAELDVARGEKERVAAKLKHPGFERYARAGRRLLEDHGQRLSFERVAIILRLRLDVARQLENLAHLVRRVVVNLDEVFVSHARRIVVSRRRWSIRCRWSRSRSSSPSTASSPRSIRCSWRRTRRNATARRRSPITSTAAAHSFR